MSRVKIVAGNWKQNGSLNLLEAFVAEFSNVSVEGVDVVICPPAVYLNVESPFGIGAQNISATADGAFTGEVSAQMVAETQAKYVIVGHSERRTLFAEDDAIVAAKFSHAQVAGLIPILCVGESLETRHAGQQNAFVTAQLDVVIDAMGIDALANAVLAYEPIWAIGTGETATPEQAQSMHAHIRSHLSKYSEEVAEQLTILYGGSVNAQNAADLFAQADIDGGLVGGASLKLAEFKDICQAAK
jgi:triosephosphate isomerase